MLEEGWFLDPLRRHEQRWMSAGEPTALVRDGAVEGHDEPPASASLERPLVPAPEVDPVDGQDLLRSDSRVAPTTNPGEGSARLGIGFG
ncbi:hypothetical protein [Motilibacter rhizosphaerae]|uniref:hypothetical protein n=1 Tax=Motilibacter rhizosphaerae TaxID=598652 RepID=UPI00102AA933|nr:hypothetical protein [Motilibacter rhizosphaerae]